MTRRLNFGLFFPPLHPPGQSPTLALEYDLQRTVWGDELGFDEVWFGEHHSSGYELIASPELMIAVAAERTRRVKLGTGVISLPYHNPFMVASRLVLLDHLTRGRVIFGAGPGALQSDQYMLDVDPLVTRTRMNESLEAVLHLLRSDEPLTMKTDWFSLRDARLQISPYQDDIEVAVAAMVTPSGPTTAGRLGLSLLSFGGLFANPEKQAGRAALGRAWDTVEAAAKAAGQLDNVDRSRWRVALPVHVAETREQAERDVMWGLAAFADLYRGGEGLLGLQGHTAESLTKMYQDDQMAVIGTAADLVCRLEELLDLSGGFGTALLFGHDWADPAATRRCYELVARHVIPHFKGQLDRPTASHRWVSEMRPALWTRSQQAIAAGEAAPTT